MKHKRILILILFVVICHSFLHAQENDSIPYQFTDSIVVNPKHHNKTIEILGVAIPVSMITYGIISLESGGTRSLDYSTRNELLEDHSMWYNGWDNYFQFSPAVAAFGMKLCGVESTHKLSDMFILYALSNALESGAVYTTKHYTSRRRPDDSNGKSFPSGHTATAFVSAEFLHQEYKDKSVWISIGGYGMATMIGVSRIYNNKHWVSDVVAGAGIGILSTKIVYWTYPYIQKAFSKKDKKQQVLIFPGYNDRNFNLNLSYTF